MLFDIFSKIKKMLLLFGFPEDEIFEAKSVATEAPKSYQVEVSSIDARSRGYFVVVVVDDENSTGKYNFVVKEEGEEDVN